MFYIYTLTFYTKPKAEINIGSLLPPFSNKSKMDAFSTNMETLQLLDTSWIFIKLWHRVGLSIGFLCTTCSRGVFVQGLFTSKAHIKSSVKLLNSLKRPFYIAHVIAIAVYIPFNLEKVNVKMYAYLLDFVIISFNTEVLQQNNCPKDIGLEEETKP